MNDSEGPETAECAPGEPETGDNGQQDPAGLPAAATSGADPNPPEPNDDGAQQDPAQSSSGPGTGEANPGDAAPKPEADQARVTVTRAETSTGVVLFVNGKRFLFPIGKPVTVPRWVLPALSSVAGVKFKQE